MKAFGMFRVIQADSRRGKLPRAMKVLSCAYKKAHRGDIIELLTTEGPIEVAVKKWCERTGNEILKSEREAGGTLVIVIQILDKDGSFHSVADSPKGAYRRQRILAK